MCILTLSSSYRSFIFARRLPVFQVCCRLSVWPFAHTGRPDARPPQPASTRHPGAGAGRLDGQPQVHKAQINSRLLMHFCIMTPFLIPTNVEPCNTVSAAQKQTYVRLQLLQFLLSVGCWETSHAIKNKPWDYLDSGLCSQKDV